MAKTIIHLMRHGEVHNPEGVLYGRLPGYVLSDLGHEMAQRVANDLAGQRDQDRRDITAVIASPLDRAQQTAAPIASAFGVEVGVDERLIEAANYFEGMTFGVGDGSLRHPQHWRFLWNPFRPSWGEPFQVQADRMIAAIDDARRLASGHEAILVSHQSPVWITRRALENRRLWHDPRKRQCSLASLTSFTYDGDRLVNISYREPAIDLLPGTSAVVA